MTAILIVEDDILANEHLEFILQQAGYEVLSATSADEAAELLEDREDVRLIVTDINLPGTVNGLKLAATAKAQQPDMNVIIVTGYSAPKNDEIPPGSLFIPKPYNARKMIFWPMNIWNSSFNWRVTWCCLRRAPTKPRSYLKIVKTFD